MRYHLTPVSITVNNNKKETSVEQGIDKTKPSCIVDENAKLYNLFGKWAVSYEANNILTVWTQLL